jgi:polyisoprenoid-binding protein YceI
MRKAGVVVVVAAVVVLAAVAGGFLLLTRNGDEPAPVGLGEPTPAPSAGAADGATGSADGTWQVVTGEDSFVGYRVQEQLAFLDAPNDAVGRTGAVQGSMTVAGDSVTAARISADLRELRSDEDRRDNAIRRNGLESEVYPEAVFELGGPMTLSATPAQGRTVKGDAAGRLTIHGRTRDVTFPLEGRWDGDTAQVAGSLQINMPDYGITPPKLGPVQAIEDQATIEVRLRFQRG